ncbi:MAG: hypothetical protein FIA97_00720 [Methylococcaceae bacterium]|nr:hypothetical protein [Methylococcaceae bacterium]
MNTSTPGPSKNNNHEKNLATVIYVLQAAGFGIVVTYFIAPIVIYWKRKAVAGTWVESHLQWQLNTFWYSVAGAAVGIAGISTPVGYMLILMDAIWVVYRIVQGWSRLSMGRPMGGTDPSLPAPQH